MEAVSVLICSYNQLIQNRHYFNERLNEKELMRKMIVIIVYLECHHNSLIFSIRALSNFPEELSKMTMNMNVTTLIN